MLAEFLDRVVGLARMSTKPEILTAPQLPDKVWLKTEAGLTEMNVPPPARKPTLGSLQSFVDVVNDETIAGSPEVYVSPSKVIAFLENSDRKECATLPLTETVRFGMLRALIAPKLLDPRELVKLLRFQLHAAGNDPLIRALARVDFTRTSSGKSSQEHGRESLGRSVEAAVQSAEQVPETFNIAVPIWSTPGLQGFAASVQIGIYLDLDAQKIEVRVLPDEIERVMGLAVKGLIELLSEQIKAPIFFGTP